MIYPFTKPKILVLGITFLLIFFSVQVKATEYTLGTVTANSTTFTVVYNDVSNVIKANFNTSTYNCGTSVISRKFTVKIDNNNIASEGVRTNGGNRSLSLNMLLDPEPNKEYSVQLILEQECFGAWTTAFDRTLKVSISSLSGFNTSFSGTTLSTTWNRGRIKTNSYTVKLSGKSIAYPGTGYQTIETKTVTGSANSTTFTDLYPGITYKTEITQNIPGDYEKTASDEISPSLTSTSKITNVSATANSTNIRLNWTNATPNIGSGSYVAVDRRRFHIGSNTESQSTIVLASLGRNTTIIPSTYTDLNEVNCHDHEYTLRMVFRKGSFEQTIFSIVSNKVSFPENLTNSPSTPNNFIVSSLNTPTSCTKDIELSWLEDLSRHECQTYWFEVDRYQLDNSGNKITSSRKTVVNEAGTGVVVTPVTIFFSTINKYTFVDVDNTKIEGAAYQYEIKTVTKWPTNQVYSSIAVTRSIEVGGTIDNSSVTVNATIDPSSFIQLTWGDLSNESGYIIRRMIGSNIDQEFTVGQNITTFTDGVSGTAARCVDYSYEVFGRNACVVNGISLGTVSTGTNTAGGTTNLTFIADFSTTYSNKDFLVHKGYERDFVYLEWDIAENASNLKNQKLYRKLISSTGNPILIATLDPGTRSYTDLEVGANQLYNYYLTAEATCGTVGANTNQIEAIGFRTPWGLINGHVDYVGGVDVEGALISAENPAAQALNKSIYFDGDRDVAFIIDNQGSTSFINAFPETKTADISFLQGVNDRTFEFWAKPESYNGGSVFSTGNYSSNPFTFFALFTPENRNSNVWNIHLGSEQIQADLAGIVAPSEWHHFAITYDGTTIKLFVDGDNLDASQKAMSWERELNTADVAAGKVVILGGVQASMLTYENNYHGHLDEFRVWNKAKTQKEIQAQKNGFLFGNESGLQIYLRMDENYGDFLYDASYEGGNTYHRRHFFIARGIQGNGLKFSTTIPASDQLGYNAITDSRGNYTIPYVRYRGTGEIFNVVPFIFQHSFRPSNRNLFIGQSSPVHNEQNFEDISAFKVTGTVFYGREENGDTVRYCPAAGLFMAIDGTIALKNGLPVSTNEFGEFELSVPIGEHYVSIETTGHTYITGRFPAEGTIDFQEEKSGIEFVDNSQTKIIGKVVGGTTEGSIPSGFGKTKNNIGQATIIFDGGCFIDTVNTDPITGEYEVNLFPLEYVVKGGANPLDQEQFVASNPNVKFPAQIEDLKFLRPILTEKDSVFDEGGELIEVKSITYSLRKDYVYRVPHSLSILDESGQKEFDTGEPFLTVIDNGIQDTLLANQFAHPLFIQGEGYKAKIKLTEIYTNNDDLSNILYDTVGVTDAQVTISNGISDENKSFQITNPSGDSLYSFFAGQPNILIDPSNSEEGFLKRCEITSVIGTTSNTWYIDGYVIGSKPNGTSFVTNGPDVVDHILRDPPGSNSSATISKETEITTSYSWDLGSTLATSNNFFLNVGAELATGVGVAVFTDIRSSVQLGIDASFSLSGGRDFTETVTFSEDLSTSDDPLFVGPDADLFIGKSVNMNFGLADYIQPISIEDCGGEQPCNGLPATSTSGKVYQLGRKPSFTVSPDGYDTYFVYTQRHIREQLIPDLKRLRNQILLNSPYYTNKLSLDDPNFGKNNDDPVFGSGVSTTTPDKRENADFDGLSYTFTKTFGPDEVQVDSVRMHNEQIRLWEQALANNEQAKLNASSGQSLPNAGSIGEAIANGIETSESLIVQETSTLNENVSFSSGSAFTRNVTLTNDIANRFTWEVNLSATLAFVVAAKVSGTGVENNHSITLGGTASGSTTTGKTQSISYEFTLQDDNLGDFYSVDILDGGNQHGPIFKIQGGVSSCPYEGVKTTNYYNPGAVLNPATVQHDRPAIAITPAIQVGIPSDEAAVYTLSLGNENLTFNGSIEYSLYLDPSSNPNGASLTIDGQNVDRNYFLSAGEIINRQLVVRKSPQQNEYRDLKLIFESACDVTVSEEVTFSAIFVPTCSNSSIITPLNQWVVNNSFENTLPITFGQYDINFSGLEKIVFRYKPSNTSQWIERASFFNKETAGGDTLLLSQSTATTIYNWDISSLEDGNYDLQLMSYCSDGTLRESGIVSGTIDRVNPHIFGRPSPADGVLSPNDDISIKFNELIDAEKIIKNLNFDVRGVLNGTPVQHYTSIGFDGDDNVSIPNMSLGNAFTHELWFNRNRTGVEEVLLQYGSITIGINNLDKVYISDGSIEVTGSSIVSSGSWYHLAVAYNHETKQTNVYLNGETDIFTASLTPQFVNTGIIIGSTFQGEIHELRIWSDARQLLEVRLNYLNTLSGNEIDLAGYWPMDEGFGIVANDKTGRRSAIVNATWHFAQEARGVVLDGIDDHYEIDGSTVAFGSEEDLTLSFWFKSDNSSNVALFSTGKVDGVEFDPQAWAVYSDAAGSLALHTNGKSYPISGNYLDGIWHHFALSVNRIGFVNLYMDGKTIISTSSQAFNSFAGNKIYFGTYGRFEEITEMKDKYMQGSIDEVRIWNTARRQEQITRDMRYRLRGDELDLFAYFPFEQYTEDAFGQLILTPTLTDQSDKIVSGLDKVSSSFVGGANYTNNTIAIKIERPVQAVNFTYAVNGDEIIITPTDENSRIENVTLDITVAGLLDKKGNRMSSPVTWIAYVDRNQVHWLESGHKAEISPNEAYQFKTKIINSGGEQMPYQIQQVPSWLTVSTTSGTISPLSQEEITFTVQTGLPLGRSVENILLSTSFGYDEVFRLDLNAKAQAPNWEVNNEDYEYSMNIIGQVTIDNIVSTNPDDMVAAIIDGEVRGVASIADLSNGRFLVFLTVYSNSLETQPISFRIWDSNQGLVLSANTSSAISFVSEAIMGGLSSPIVIASGDEVAYNYQLRTGWNWLSLPFTFLDATPTNVLFDLNATTNDVFKGQANFAQYQEGLQWGGSLTSVNALAGYKLSVATTENFEVVGTPVAVSTPITLVKGWNWIAYLPTVRQQINSALSGYPAIDGDLIKDQTSFAVFDEGTSRWVGTLTVMDPTKGYLLSTSEAGQLIYSNSASSGSFLRLNEAKELPIVHDFQTNMSVIVNTDMVDGSYACTAYHNGQLRGRVEPIEGKYYLTIHGKEGEQIDLKFENELSEVEIAQTIAYESDAIKRISLISTVVNKDAGLTSYPTPFGSVLNLQYTNIEGGNLKVSLYSITGVELERIFEGSVSDGNHSFAHTSELEEGLYLLISELNGVVTVKKVIK